MMCFIYIFHLLTQINPQLNNVLIMKQIICLKNLDHQKCTVGVMSKKWDLRNWIETGNEGIVKMRICSDLYNVHTVGILFILKVSAISRSTPCDSVFLLLIFHFFKVFHHAMQLNFDIL
jgi:hypothetical protein